MSHRKSKGPSGPISFVGDAGYAKNLSEEFVAKYGTPRLSLLPFRAYEPRLFMCYAHMNPAEEMERAAPVPRRPPSPRMDSAVAKKEISALTLAAGGDLKTLLQHQPRVGAKKQFSAAIAPHA